MQTGSQSRTCDATCYIPACFLQYLHVKYMHFKTMLQAVMYRRQNYLLRQTTMFRIIYLIENNMKEIRIHVTHSAIQTTTMRYDTIR